MDRKLISIVKKSLRKASLTNPARTQAKNKAKIAPSLFRCQCGNCELAIYEGSSDANFDKLSEDFSDLWLQRGKGHVDHIKPVREGKGDFDWDDYITSLFCEVDNLQYLAPSCHDIKSKMDKNGK